MSSWVLAVPWFGAACCVLLRGVDSYLAFASLALWLAVLSWMLLNSVHNTIRNVRALNARCDALEGSDRDE